MSEHNLGVEYIGSLARLDAKPGDRFVLMTEHNLCQETMRRLQGELSRALGGATVIVLGEGMKLGIVGANVGSVPQEMAA